MKFNKVLCITLLFGGLLLSEVMMAQKRYQIGVCDWMVLKRQKLGEFKLARELGCDGLEMDMGGLGKRDSLQCLAFTDRAFLQSIRGNVSLKIV